MRHVRLAFVLLAAAACAACGPALDPKGTERPKDVSPSANGAAPAAPPVVCAPGELCEEPFAIAEVGFDVDVFAKPPAIPLPIDASIEIGKIYGSVGQGPDAKPLAQHYAIVTYPGDIDVFDREIAARMRVAVAMPPQTWLAFHRTTNAGTRALAYQSVVLRKPLLLTSADVATARAAERGKTELVIGKTPAESQTNEVKTYAVDVTLSDAGSARLAAWVEKHPAHPIAHVVHGRVVDYGPMAGHVKRFWVDLAWLAPAAAQAGAEKLAKEIEGRALKK